MRHGGGFQFLAALFFIGLMGLFTLGAFGVGIAIGAGSGGTAFADWGHGSVIVGNALRYAPQGTIVEIVGTAHDGTVTVAVTDGGPGIAPDVLPNLFERFAKSEDSRGTGLGLAIARRLVEAHDGSIRAVVPERGGTTITFELPVRAEG